MRGMAKERKTIQKHVTAIVYYMQGGLNYTDAFKLDLEQLDIMISVIEEHYDKQNKALTGNKHGM